MSMELEERSVETLPERCQNCGTPLTEAEKAAALEDPGPVVLCTTCAAEAAALPEDEDEELGAGG
jgi:hypothetical protein